ncbi:Uncharacterised protein [Mycobacteroides abscessus subsp. abscessus]|nr:Uncharacterised protein [Mycobacteroides abscessus subsp. abscessus]
MDVIPLISEGFMERRHAMGTAILDRAVDRGEIGPDLDHDLILDALAGITLFRLTLRPGRPQGTDDEVKDTYRTLVKSLVGATGARARTTDL